MRFFIGSAACVTMVLFILFPQASFACGHDGFFFGGGYAQSHLFTHETRFFANSNVNRRITFGPGFGGHAVLGYDVCKTRWGFQVPVEFVSLRINGNERTQLLTVNSEVIYHIASWENGIDVHLVAGGGINYLREGETFDRSASYGANINVGPGVSWYFARAKTLSGALTLQIPIRSILFFGDRLTRNNTLVFVIPVRFGMTFGF